MQSFSYKQTPLYYQDIGEGKVVLYIHGFLENHSMWKNTIENFSSKCRCVAPDLFGHGNSPALGYVHSMNVALELLKLQSEKITEIVLLNSTPLPDSTERKKDRERAIRAIQKFPDAFVQMAVKNLFLPEKQNRLAKEIDEAISEAKKCSQHGIIATLQGLKNRVNHVETFANAKCNKLVIAGKKDQVVPFEFK